MLLTGNIPSYALSQISTPNLQEWQLFFDTENGNILTSVSNEAGTVVVKVYGQSIEHYRGLINCSTNPNYPASTGGDYFIVSVGGKIGGGAGKNVNAGDLIICNTTNAGGNEAAVGSDFDIYPNYLSLIFANTAQAQAGTSAVFVMNPSVTRDAIQGGAFMVINTTNFGGSANALIAANPNGGLSGLINDQIFDVKIASNASANTSSVTLAIGANPSKPLVKLDIDGTAINIVAGEFQPNMTLRVRYNLGNDTFYLLSNQLYQTYTPFSNEIYVDEAHGIDSKGIANIRTAPFATITAAQAVAVSGDTITILPGVYTDINLGKNGVTYNFLPGASMNSTGRCFYDGGIVMTVYIKGYPNMSATTGIIVQDVASTFYAQIGECTGTIGFIMDAVGSGGNFNLDVQGNVTMTGRAFAMYNRNIANSPNVFINVSGWVTGSVPFEGGCIGGQGMTANIVASAWINNGNLSTSNCIFWSGIMGGGGIICILESSGLCLKQGGNNNYAILSGQQDPGTTIESSLIYHTHTGDCVALDQSPIFGNGVSAITCKKTHIGNGVSLGACVITVSNSLILFNKIGDYVACYDAARTAPVFDISAQAGSKVNNSGLMQNNGVNPGNHGWVKRGSNYTAQVLQSTRIVLAGGVTTYCLTGTGGFNVFNSYPGSCSNLVIDPVNCTQVISTITTNVNVK